MNKLLLCFVALLVSMASSAADLVMRGTIGEKFPIVIEFDVRPDGSFGGRYAYESTLRRSGNDDSSYLRFTRAGRNNSSFDIIDEDLNTVEHWTDVRIHYEDDGIRLEGTVTNAKGLTFAVKAATVPTEASAAWAGRFRITGGVYRLCDAEATLAIYPSGRNSFIGHLDLEEGGYGSLSATVKGSVANGVLSLTLGGYMTQTGDSGDIFNNRNYPELRARMKIAQIRNAGGKFSIQIMGAMQSYIEPTVGVEIVKLGL